MDPPNQPGGSRREEVEGLPPGWKKKAVLRTSGARTDTYYYSPCGKPFRSKNKVKEFLGNDVDLSQFFSHKGSKGTTLASCNSTLPCKQKLKCLACSSRLDGLKQPSSKFPELKCPSSRSERVHCPCSESEGFYSPNSKLANKNGRGELRAAEAMEMESADMQGRHGDTILTGIISGYQKVDHAHLFTRSPRIVLNKMRVGSTQLPVYRWHDTWVPVGNSVLEKRSKKYPKKGVESLIVSIPLSEGVKTSVRELSEKVEPVVCERTDLQKRVSSVQERKLIKGSRKRKMGKLSRIIRARDDVRMSNGTCCSVAETIGLSGDCRGRSKVTETAGTCKKQSCSQARHDDRNQTAVDQPDNPSLVLRFPQPIKYGRLIDGDKKAEMSNSQDVIEKAPLEPHQQRETFDDSESEVSKPSRKRHRVCPKKITIQYSDSESEGPLAGKDLRAPTALRRENTPVKHFTDPQPPELPMDVTGDSKRHSIAKERVSVAKEKSKVRARKNTIEDSTDDDGSSPTRPVKPAKRLRKQAKSAKLSAAGCSNKTPRKGPSASSSQQPLTTAEAIKRPKKRVRRHATPEGKKTTGEHKRPRGKAKKKCTSLQQMPPPVSGSKNESQQQQQAEDSGYPCSLSNSDASSRLWHSISPENQLSSLAAVEDISQGSHIQDHDSKIHSSMPIPHDSTPLDSVPQDSFPHDTTAQGATAFVATPCCDRTALNVLEPNPDFAEDQDLISPLAQDHDPNLQDHSFHSHANYNNNMNNSIATPNSHADLLADLQLHLPAVTVAETHTESAVMVMNTCDHLTIRIFPELDALLDQSPEPERTFEPGQMIISKVESLSGRQELLEYDDVGDTILDSESLVLNVVDGDCRSPVATEAAYTGQTCLSGPVNPDFEVAPAETAQGPSTSQTCLSSLIAPKSEANGVIPAETAQAGIDSGQTSLSSFERIAVDEDSLAKNIMTSQASFLQPAQWESQLVGEHLAYQTSSLGVEIGSMEPEVEIGIGLEIEVGNMEPLSSNVSIATTGESSVAASQTGTGSSATAQLSVDPCHKKKRVVRAKRRLQRKKVEDNQREHAGLSPKCESAEVVVLKAGKARADFIDHEEVVGNHSHTVSVSKSGRILRPSWKASPKASAQPATKTTTVKESVSPDHLTRGSPLAASAPDARAPQPAFPLTPSDTPMPTASGLTSSGFSMSLDTLLKEMGSDTSVVASPASGSTVPAAVIPASSNGSKKIKRLKLTKKPSPLVLFSESATTKQQRNTPDERSSRFNLDLDSSRAKTSCSAVEDTDNLEVFLAPLDMEELLPSPEQLQPSVSCHVNAVESLEVDQLPASEEEALSGKGLEAGGPSDSVDNDQRGSCRSDVPRPSPDEEECEDILEIFAEDYDAFTSYSCPANEKKGTPPKMPTLNSPPSPVEHPSPDYNNGASMPYKKEQVAQWVLEQRMSHHPPPPLPLGDTPLPLDAPKCPSQELLDMPPRPSSSSTASSHVRWRRGLNDRSQSYADNAVERGSYWQPFDSSNCNPNGGLCAPDTYSRSSHLHLPLPLSHGHPKNPGFWEPECERRRDPFFNRSCLPHNSFFEGGLEHPQGRRLADPYLPLPPPPATHVLPHNSRDQSFTSQPPLPNGSSQETGNNYRYCKYYLRGNCTYIPCRFVHAQRDAVSECVLEEALFCQPLEKVPKDIIGHYVADHASHSVVLSKFPLFVDLVRALMDKSLPVAVTPYQLLALSKVNFSARLLSRLLDLCGDPSQTAHTLPPVHHIPTLARELFSKIQIAQGYLTTANYLALMKTLAAFNLHIQLYDVYQRMRQSGVSPSLEVLHVVLGQAKYLDHRVFQTLQDLKQCNPTEMEEAKFLNRLVDSVDYQLLEKHCDTVGALLESSPHLKDKIGFDVFERLFRAFRANNQWNHLLTLFEYCHKFLPDFGDESCIVTEMIIDQPGLKERAMNLIDRMPADLALRLSAEVLDMVMIAFAESGRSQRVSKLYHTLTKQRKQLSTQVLKAVMEMYIRQHNPAAAVVVLQDSLRLTPPILPPVTVLDSLCQALEQSRGTQELYGVIEGLLRNKIAPSSTILQSLLSLHSKDKAYSKLAEVVKKAQIHGVKLDKDFYQKSLVELRHWGQDQEAISAVYKALRKVQSSAKVLEGDSAIHVDNQICDTNNPSQDCSVLVASSPPPPAPPPSGGSGATVGGAGAPSMSLAGLLQQSSTEDQASLLELIEVNGKQGQFGAVAAILVSMRCGGGGVSYDSRTVEAVWKTITNSRQKPANAFASLITHLSQSRSAVTPPAGSTSPGEPLLQNDRWLISQVGIGLMQECERKQDWQNAFVVLHHLHRFGIHYVMLSHPTLTLPALRPTPTPCGVALMAIKICLMVDQTTGALEVLKGCNWIRASSAEELVRRTELLMTLTEHCLNSKMYPNAWECLEAIDSSAIQKRFIYGVTNLHNKLLQSLLGLQQSDFALQIYRTMSSAKLQCLPSIFSTLLHGLCNSEQKEVAKQLCQTAIEKGFYGPVAKGNLFHMSLPMGLSRVEIHLLLESHLQRIALELDKGKLQTLTVHFTAGSRLTLEEVLSHDCCPSLRAFFSGAGASSASIPPASLQHWLDAHSSNCSGGGTSVSVSSASKRPLQRRTFKLKRSGPASANTKGVKEAAPLGSCGDSSSSKEPQTTSPVALTKELVGLSDSESQSSLDLITLLAGKEQKGEKHQRKQFRQQVCLQFKTCLQSYYKAKKFRTDDDYPHLLKVLSTQYYKLRRNQGLKDWIVTEARKEEIQNIVIGVMSKCSVYSHQMDSELSLSCSSSE